MSDGHNKALIFPLGYISDFRYIFSLFLILGLFLQQSPMILSYDAHAPFF